MCPTTASSGPSLVPGTRTHDEPSTSLDTGPNARAASRHASAASVSWPDGPGAVSRRSSVSGIVMRADSTLAAVASRLREALHARRAVRGRAPRTGCRHTGLVARRPFLVGDALRIRALDRLPRGGRARRCERRARLVRARAGGAAGLLAHRRRRRSRDAARRGGGADLRPLHLRDGLPARARARPAALGRGAHEGGTFGRRLKLPHWWARHRLLFGAFFMSVMTAEIATDLLTPLGAYLRLREGARAAFLLESVERGRLGRHSFVGRGSRIVDFAEAEALGEPVVGYVGYDVVARLEPTVPLPEDGPGFPESRFVVPELLVRFDHARGVAEVLVGDAAEAARLFDGPQPDAPRGTGTRGELHRYPDRDEHLERVERAKEYIREGDVFQ